MLRMGYKKFKFLLTLTTVTSIVLSLIFFILCLGGGGVLNDLYFALDEMRDLEAKNLLHSPPADISPITRREIDLVHNSKGLETYIQENHRTLSQFEKVLSIFIVLSVLTLTLQVFLYFYRRLRRHRNRMI